LTCKELGGGACNGNWNCQCREPLWGAMGVLAYGCEYDTESGFRRRFCVWRRKGGHVVLVFGVLALSAFCVFAFLKSHVRKRIDSDLPTHSYFPLQNYEFANYSVAPHSYAPLPPRYHLPSSLLQIISLLMVWIGRVSLLRIAFPIPALASTRTQSSTCTTLPECPTPHRRNRRVLVFWNVCMCMGHDMPYIVWI
jgi:hypothetical protein